MKIGVETEFDTRNRPGLQTVLKKTRVISQEERPKENGG
jgi:hypothetical protein